MIRKLAFLGLAYFVGKKLLDRSAPATDGSPVDVGHAPTDLHGENRPDGSQRADPHYRPDPHSPIPAEDLEGLRPVTFKPAPSPAGYTS